jgi:1-aminocyclopropane-1-carboxylate synthase
MPHLNSSSKFEIKILQALNSLAPFSSISNHTQHVLSEVLSDKSWTANFISQNTALLEASYDTLTENLTMAGIPFVSAQAGMFVWIDLRAWLPDTTWEGERSLWGRICNECKVILTPGESCHAREPGYFRLCFAWMPKESLQEAVIRIKSNLS